MSQGLAAFAYIQLHGAICLSVRLSVSSLSPCACLDANLYSYYRIFWDYMVNRVRRRGQLHILTYSHIFPIWSLFELKSLLILITLVKARGQPPFIVNVCSRPKAEVK